MRTLRDAWYRLTNQVPERELIGRGYVVRRVGLGTWEYRSPRWALEAGLVAYPVEVETVWVDFHETAADVGVQSYRPEPDPSEHPVPVLRHEEESGSDRRTVAEADRVVSGPASDVDADDTGTGLSDSGGADVAA